MFISEADWRAILDNNLSSTIMVCQAVAKHMIAEELPGRIVTVSSDAAYLANDHGSQAIYATSKAAVNHYSKALAQQLRWHPPPRPAFSLALEQGYNCTCALIQSLTLHHR